MKRLERSESRTVAKKCPECDQQCPVALRACNCGYSFTKTRPIRTKVRQQQQLQQQQLQQQQQQRQASVAKAARGAAAASTSTTVSESDASLDKVGRRFRTKRMRPDYFNSLELEYASRTFRTRKPKQEKTLKSKKKRGRPKGSSSLPRKSKEEKKKDEEEPKPFPELDDLYANFSQERLQQFSFILDELNFKMSSQIFKPL